MSEDVPKPTWERLAMRCGPCGHEWDDWQPSNCAPSVWIAQVKSLYCPKCGAKRKLFIRFGINASTETDKP